MTNKLFFGDNLEVLRKHVKDETVDLIYLDPPFNSKASYNILFKTPVGEPSDAQIHAFDDTWKWESGAELAMDQIRERSLDTFKVLQSLRSFLGQSDVMAYLAMMAVRLIELRRVMKPEASLYLHCDPTASHYLKVMMDAIFGGANFQAEIIWRRTNARGTKAIWPRLHDTILQYSKTEKFTFAPVISKADVAKTPHTLITGADGLKYQTYELTGAGVTQDGESGRAWRGFNPTGMGRHWGYSHSRMDDWDQAGLIHWPQKGGFPRRRDATAFDPSSRTVVTGDVWTDIDRINQAAKERLRYPTQKPVALLERIIGASSNPGDLVLDPFCGCGTTIHAAERLKRRWIGIDITYPAIQVISDRLRTWLPQASYTIDGIPKDELSARKLAKLDPHRFQQWAVGQCGGQSRDKGADKGIDGEIIFQQGRNDYGRAIVSVKGGQHVNPDMLRALKGTVAREGAELGIFICLGRPTKDMRMEAATAGVAALPWGKVPKIRILTVADLIAGPQLGLPTRMNSIQSAEAARVVAARIKERKPTPEEIRRQPGLKLPISGGHSKSRQAVLPLDDDAVGVRQPRARSRQQARLTSGRRARA